MSSSDRADQSSYSKEKAAPSSEEAKIQAYEIHRRKMGEHNNREVRLNTRGIGSMLLISGYAIQYNEPQVFAIIPIIFSYLIIRTVESRMWMMNKSRQAIRIEKELAPEGDSFRYEHEYGGTLGKELEGDQHYRDVPGGLRALLVFSIYYVTTLGVVFGVWPLKQPLVISGVRISQSLLSQVYFILFCFVAISIFSALYFREYIKSEFS